MDLGVGDGWLWSYVIRVGTGSGGSILKIWGSIPLGKVVYVCY